MPFSARGGFLAQQFVAGGPVAHTITALGDANTSTAQRKFGPTSAEFDGAGGDGLRVVPNSESDFIFDGDVTIEFWFRVESDTGDASASLISGKQTSASSGNYQWFILWRNFDRKLQVALPGNVNMPLQATAMNLNQWYHVALVRNGTGTDNCTLYIDGTSVSTATSDVYSFGDTTNGDNNIGIGSFQDGALPLNQGGNGYIDEVRISRTARYTSAFTPQEYAFTYDDDTELLVHMDGIGDNLKDFYDDIGTGIGRATPAFTFEDGAQLDTAVKKFGTASMKFDGANDRVIWDNKHRQIDLSGDEWTIEYWVYIDAHQGAFTHNFSAWEGGASGEMFYTSVNMFSGTNKQGIQFYNTSNSNSGAQSRGSALATDEWIHLAWVYKDDVITFYQDGTNVGTLSASLGIRWVQDTRFTMGTDPAANGDYFGWMDELRVSNIARYTDNFSAPAAEHTNDANTQLLLHFNGADASTELFDDNQDPS